MPHRDKYRVVNVTLHQKMAKKWLVFFSSFCLPACDQQMSQALSYLDPEERMKAMWNEIRLYVWHDFGGFPALPPRSRHLLHIERAVSNKYADCWQSACLKNKAKSYPRQDVGYAKALPPWPTSTNRASVKYCNLHTKLALLLYMLRYDVGEREKFCPDRSQESVFHSSRAALIAVFTRSSRYLYVMH